MSYNVCMDCGSSKEIITFQKEMIMRRLPVVANYFICSVCAIKNDLISEHKRNELFGKKVKK